MGLRPSIGNSGVGIAGSIGGDRTVTVSGNERGIDFGISGGGIDFGISTDYGGAGKIGIGGQSITWGLKGGKLRFGVAGFEVIVEARDCVVTEVKKIAGMTVATRTYPDPGCPLPAEPPTPTPTPTPTPLGSEPRVDVPNNNEYYFVIVGEIAIAPSLVRGQTSIPNIITLPKPDETIYQYPIPFTVERKEIRYDSLSMFAKKYRCVKGENTPYNFYRVGPAYEPLAGAIAAGSTEYLNENTGKWELAPYYNVIPIAFYGRGIDLNIFFDIDRAEAIKASDYNAIAGYYFPVKVIPLKPQKILLPPIGGNRPPMNTDCCKEILAELKDFKKVLAVKEMLEGKATFPWRLRIPGGQGEEKIYDYPSYLRAIAQEIDHLGIHPPKLSIKDINNAIAGDQSIDNQFPSATQGFEALMAQVWDANADVDTLTNFLYRLSWLCVQQSMNIARLSGDVQALKDMIGGATEPTEASITTPFNIGAGVKESTKGKGFGKNGAINQEIDRNTELATESLLPDFLKVRKNSVMLEKFSGNQDLFDMVALLLIKVESLQRGQNG